MCLDVYEEFSQKKITQPFSENKERGARPFFSLTQTTAILRYGSSSVSSCISTVI